MTVEQLLIIILFMCVVSLSRRVTDLNRSLNVLMTTTERAHVSLTRLLSGSLNSLYKNQLHLYQVLQTMGADVTLSNPLNASSDIKFVDEKPNSTGQKVVALGDILNLKGRRTPGPPPA